MVVRIGMKKASHPIDLLGRGRTEQQITEHVQRGEREVVDGVERGKADSVELALAAARPELIEPARAKMHDGLIPEARVEFKRNRYVRVEQVSSPLPLRLSDHRRKVVLREVLAHLRWLVAKRCKRIASTENRFRRAVKIDIVLGPKARMLRVAGP